MKKILCLLCIVFVVGLFFTTVGEAGIYIKRDKRGTINLTDNPDGDDYTLLMASIKSKIPEDYEVPSAEELSKMVSAAADRHNIPEALIYAVIQVESNGDSQAKSHRGASGLMQLMPATARELGVKDIWDPQQNINGGSRYLKQMLNRFDGNLTLTLAAYNAGPGNVEKYDGVPPFSETKQFIERVRGAFDSFKVKRDTIYTYVDERGITNVTNIK
jgi:soluble lytic murein transglycosylase-like protein